MVGIYKYECGLEFTGIIAETYEKAEEYLGNLYGSEQEVYDGCDENGNYKWKKKFVPWYRKEAFVIEKVTLV